MIEGQMESRNSLSLSLSIAKLQNYALQFIPPLYLDVCEWYLL